MAKLNRFEIAFKLLYANLYKDFSADEFIPFRSLFAAFWELEKFENEANDHAYTTWLLQTLNEDPSKWPEAIREGLQKYANELEFKYNEYAAIYKYLPNYDLKHADIMEEVLLQATKDNASKFLEADKLAKEYYRPRQKAWSPFSESEEEESENEMSGSKRLRFMPKISGEKDAALDEHLKRLHSLGERLNTDKEADEEMAELNEIHAALLTQADAKELVVDAEIEVSITNELINLDDFSFKSTVNKLEANEKLEEEQAKTPTSKKVRFSNLTEELEEERVKAPVQKARFRNLNEELEEERAKTPAQQNTAIDEEEEEQAQTQKPPSPELMIYSTGKIHRYGKILKFIEKDLQNIAEYMQYRQEQNAKDTSHTKSPKTSPKTSPNNSPKASHRSPKNRHT